MFKKNQIVIVDSLPKDHELLYPFHEGERMLFLGEITNTPGHCIVVNCRGRVIWGYHTDNFREPTEDEL